MAQSEFRRGRSSYIANNNRGFSSFLVRKADEETKWSRGKRCVPMLFFKIPFPLTDHKKLVFGKLSFGFRVASSWWLARRYGAKDMVGIEKRRNLG